MIHASDVKEAINKIPNGASPGPDGVLPCLLKRAEDILQSKEGKAKLATQAQCVKQVLSTLDTAHCYVASLFDGMDFSCNVTRARFDNQLSPVLSALMAPVSALLTRAGLDPEDLDKVVLVGGTANVVKV
jgi:molecular chaperone DnaK (HSP70)